MDRPSRFSDSSCMASLDLIFALDGSHSMGEYNFQLQQQSLIRLISTLAVNETNVRVGVIVFSDDAIVSVELTGNRQAVTDGINAAAYPDENTRTDLAIQAAMDMFERSARGGSVPMLLEIVTDGESSEQELTLQRAEEAKARGIDIYAVGIGMTRSAVDTDELKMIVSKDDQGNPQLFLVDDFEALEASLNNATNLACVSLDCEPGKYGKDCRESCSAYCSMNGIKPGDSPCDRIIGYCLKGCLTGYRGPRCLPLAHDCKDDDSALVIGLGVGIAILGIVVIVVTVVSLYCNRRIKHHNTHTSQQGDRPGYDIVDIRRSQHDYIHPDASSDGYILPSSDSTTETYVVENSPGPGPRLSADYEKDDVGHYEEIN